MEPVIVTGHDRYAKASQDKTGSNWNFVCEKFLLSQ